jgi:hypothetical protein
MIFLANTSKKMHRPTNSAEKALSPGRSRQSAVVIIHALFCLSNKFYHMQIQGLSKHPVEEGQAVFP